MVVSHEDSLSSELSTAKPKSNQMTFRRAPKPGSQGACSLDSRERTKLTDISGRQKEKGKNTAAIAQCSTKSQPNSQLNGKQQRANPTSTPLATAVQF